MGKGGEQPSRRSPICGDDNDEEANNAKDEEAAQAAVEEVEGGEEVRL